MLLLLLYDYFGRGGHVNYQEEDSKLKVFSKWNYIRAVPEQLNKLIDIWLRS